MKMTRCAEIMGKGSLGKSGRAEQWHGKWGVGKQITCAFAQLVLLFNYISGSFSVLRGPYISGGAPVPVDLTNSLDVNFDLCKCTHCMRMHTDENSRTNNGINDLHCP